eukprot:gnl/TRDRNA2_/TRDRNA2_166121_c2_seq1.p1 gnl/TRDRNA2_/TRDRNA2_166121_c2~~gnl/TRDRNA2_/TRDRNA2_166121_c2_seq1.p1  ORF type:complete len:266 (+),score=57.14 gnl/TRDRNA2_/TRDRNA2_166121_c2_seq1:1-798(+)
MNIVTGVFVESALMSAKEDKDAEMRSSMKEMFDEFDDDESGTINWAELVSLLGQKGNRKMLKSMGMDVSKLKALFTLLSGNKEEVNINELILGCQRIHGPAKAVDLEMLMFYNKQMAICQLEHATAVENDLRFLLANMQFIIDLNQGESTGGAGLPANDGEQGVVSSTQLSEAASNSSQLGRLRKPERALSSATLGADDPSRSRVGPMWLSWAELEAEGNRLSAELGLSDEETPKVQSKEPASPRGWKAPGKPGALSSNWDRKFS